MSSFDRVGGGILLMGFFALLVSFVVGFALGVLQGREIERTWAVKSGSAVYKTDVTSGTFVFEYIKGGSK